MLQKIRDRSQGWMTWLIIGIICFSFALFGIHNYMNNGNSGNEVAMVNGVSITQAAWTSQFEQLQEQQREQLKQSQVPTADINAHLDSTSPQIRKEALAQLITNEVLVQGAMAQHFYATDEQAESALLAWPIFQENGTFSPARFSTFLRTLIITQAQLLQQIKRQLLVEQVSDGLKNSAFALPSEVNAAIKLREQSREFSYVLINPATMTTTPSMDEKQLHEYYEAHKAMFKMPEQVQLEYVLLSPDAFIPKQGSTQTPEQWFAQTSEKLASLSYENPSSLETVAIALNLPIQVTDHFTSNGEKTGIASNRAVVQAAFSPEVLQQQYNSDVITLDPQTQVVIHLRDHKPATFQSFEEVSDQVKLALQQQLQRQAAQQLGEDIQTALRQGQSLTALAQQHALQVIPVVATAKDPTVDSAILRAVFALAYPQPTEPAITGSMLPSGNYLVAVLTQVQPGTPEKFSAEEKETIASQLKEVTGAIDYSYYVNSLMNKADIER